MMWGRRLGFRPAHLVKPIFFRDGGWALLLLHGGHISWATWRMENIKDSALPEVDNQFDNWFVLKDKSQAAVRSSHWGPELPACARGSTRWLSMGPGCACFHSFHLISLLPPRQVMQKERRRKRRSEQWKSLWKQCQCAQFFLWAQYCKNTGKITKVRALIHTGRFSTNAVYTGDLGTLQCWISCRTMWLPVSPLKICCDVEKQVFWLQTSRMERVVLLKGEKDGSSGGASDAYQDLLEREGFQVTMVPVLQFNFVNSSRIPPMLTSETASSLVLTSPRAVIALSKSLQEEYAAEVLKSWREKKVFCVGPSTAKTTKVL